MTDSDFSDCPELTQDQFASMIRSDVRKRLVLGEIQSGADLAALARYVHLSPQEFAQALGVSLETFTGWVEDRGRPNGSALVLIRIAARHPRILREQLGLTDKAAA